MKFFPFEKVRPEQNKLLGDIAEIIKNKQHLVAHAPTGLGKTAAALTPIIEHALENNLTIFFLTSRNAQHKLVIETLQKINKIHPIKAVDFVGKKHMCPKMRDFEQSNINFFEFCIGLRKDRACDFFNNCYEKIEYSKHAKEFVNELFKKGPLDVEELIDLCKENNLCTYEISLLLARSANVIVADYFHIFDPSIQQILFKKMQKDLSKTIIIIDEAHNLPDRIRNDWTLKLNTFLLNKLAEKLKDQNKTDLSEKIVLISKALQSFSIKKLANETEIYVNREDFISLIEQSTGQNYNEFKELFFDITDEIEERDESDEIFKFNLFLKYWPNIDKGFVRILRKEKTQSGKTFPSIEYHCLDPSIVSEPLINSSYSTILMSGTLLPSEMYRDILGLDKKRTQIKSYKNPFPRKNKLVLVSPDITTKYESRTEAMFKKIATSCAYIINSVDGNSAIFFSSYDLLSKTIVYLEKICQKKLFIEKRRMSKLEKENLINQFKNSVIGGGAALIGVQGASFSEGIDLPGELLKAVAIVGVPLAPPDLRQKALIEYYDEKYHKGWDYGYVFPAINRALQAAGRCIRSETDKGFVAFLDKRFNWSKYKKIIPPDWNMKVSEDFRKEIKTFFDNNK